MWGFRERKGLHVVQLLGVNVMLKVPCGCGFVLQGNWKLFATSNIKCEI